MEHTSPTVTLAQPPRIPEQYRDTIVEFVQALWQHYRWHMQEQFGFHSLPPVVDYERAMITDTLAEIARTATGEVTGEDALSIVAEGIQGLCEMLFATPAAGNTYMIPAYWWDTNLGQMVALALLRVRGDGLITMAEAAELRGVTVQAIAQALNSGRLRGYYDPAAPARQGRRLVSRQDVERM